MSFNASFQDLKNIFNNNICVRDIAESLISFDSEKPAKTVKKFMIEKEFTVVGLRRKGDVEGYVKKDNLAYETVIFTVSVGEYSGVGITQSGAQIIRLKD